MNRIWKEIGIAFLMGMLLPGILLHLAVEIRNARVEVIPVTEPNLESSELVIIPVLTDSGAVQEMELEDYLAGVVLAEMPTSFEEEALKAQAVVARTYTLRSHLGKSKHDHASVCTDSGCCQGYRNQNDYLSAGGTLSGIQKVKRAVDETTGYVLTFDGELIEATYFSCSGGKTEDAVAVWGTEVPYLRSVDSPGEEKAAYYTDQMHFTTDQIEEKLDIDLQDSADEWITDVSYTAGGGIDEIRIGGKLFSGTELRQILGLRSTAFTVSHENGSITFTTRGYGHRVGMSQNGADAMAVNGSTYREILLHYYPGTALEHRTD